MHPMYADILDITPLSLNAHFRTQDAARQCVDANPCNGTVEQPFEESPEESLEESLDVNSILFSDINRASKQPLSGIYVANNMQRHEGRLYIPAKTLSSAQKRQLWLLISE
ncbi:hypothetical protein HG263_13510 [Pseudoalteromonas sp. JBTF-M23]|uniref:Uncharacterized protein n=1 Tax=Pseudoalteromonas caenipelagi TaxID=2726988 RepID=A0A849VFM9_9GAMM|nr:hypothetical protein [Pseudoalteromonas caenipelagi]NOU51548.1 hypothetical protein [Pseudoalteromonas caenipelagi]